MRLWLPAHVHAVRIDEDLVILDEWADAYFCLAGAAPAVDLQSGGGVEMMDETAAGDLIAAGLLTRDAQPVRGALPLKAGADLAFDPVRPGAAEILALSRACFTSVYELKRHAFAGLLARARGRSRRPADGKSDLEAVLAAAKAFSRLRPWAPVGGACLQRSYLMLAYLHNLGLDAEWVIGVRTWPFMAHCWLQAGGVSLEEDAERLVAYSPILAVR